MRTNEKLIDALSDRVYTIEHGNLVEIDASGKAVYSIYVKKNPSLTVRSDMHSSGNRYELTAEEAALKATVLGLYEDGWEIIGIKKHD